MFKEFIILVTSLTFIEAKVINKRLSNSIIENLDINNEWVYDSAPELLYKNEISDDVAITRTHNGHSSDVPQDAKLNTLELLRKYGYPAEAHEVITQDGYILTLHRIPHGRHNKNETKSRPVVLLHHGLLCSSSDWLMNSVDKALGYRLADEGYDVWLSNARGNTYSRRHTTLSPEENAFWDFSFHEIGVYDVTSEIDYILGTTGESQINYIGHSMGTVVFWVAMSERPEYNSKIRLMLALGPVAFLKGMKSPRRHFEAIATEIQLMERLFGEKEFWPVHGIIKDLETFLCGANFVEKLICENIVFLICGYDRPQINESMIPVVTAHTPAGTSTHNVIHFLQVAASGKFRQFDLGKRRNLKKYGSEQPLDYNLSNVKAKVALFYGQNDWMADPDDVLELAAKLPNNVLTYKVKSETFNHLDFLFAIDCNELLYNDLLRYLRKL